MGLLDKARKTVQRLVPPSLMPQPKVLAAFGGSAVTSGIVWFLKTRGIKIPRSKVNDVVAWAVSGATVIPVAVAYIKADKGRVVIPEVTQ